jgi:hypothetical protein
MNGKKYRAYEVAIESKSTTHSVKESKYDGDRPNWSTNIPRASVEMYKIIGPSSLTFSELVSLLEEKLKVRNAVAQGMIQDYTDPKRPWKIFKKANGKYTFNYQNL